jgi:hypothetical protein
MPRWKLPVDVPAAGFPGVNYLPGESRAALG